MDRGGLRIGDTLTDGAELEFSGIPRFAPEHFARIILGEPMKRKQLDTGLRQLTEEGAAQVFFTSGTETTSPTPIVGAVGELQFDVMSSNYNEVIAARTQVNLAVLRKLRAAGVAFAAPDGKPQPMPEVGEEPAAPPAPKVKEPTATSNETAP